jgi:hypothetical protein
MKSTEPWLISPALTPDRLFRLAQLAVRVRARLAELHEPEEGDDAWTFGCRAYKRTCFGYSRLAELGDDPGMVVDVDVLKCRMSFDGEPITFYRGDAEHPPAKVLQRGLKNLMNQTRLPFYEERLAEEDEGWFWLLAIEPKNDGTVLSVGVVQANATGEIRNPWLIPLDAPVAVVTAVSEIKRDAVKLPPPPVDIKTDADAVEEDKGDSVEDSALGTSEMNIESRKTDDGAGD